MRTSLVAILACASACTGQPTGVPREDLAYVPGVEWRRARGGVVRVEESGLNRLQTDIVAGRYGAIDAVLVVRNGWLIHEQYLGWNATQGHTAQSVTKSITSLVVGAALGRGMAASTLDQPVVDVLERTDVASLDDRKKRLTLRHLLTMRTGLNFYEQPYEGSPLQALNNSAGDWAKIILDRPMTAEPGSRWAYNSGAPILICAALRKRLGESPVTFARRELFQPIGVTTDRWFISPFDGLPHCGGGLNISPSDLARVGLLVLRKGRWGERQVVPESWIEESTAEVSTGPELFYANANAGYGAYWWLFPRQRGGADRGVIAASGSGGQWLFVVPSLDLIVVLMAREGYGLDLLYDGVLPIVR